MPRILWRVVGVLDCRVVGYATTQSRTGRYSGKNFDRRGYRSLRVDCQRDLRDLPEEGQQRGSKMRCETIRRDLGFLIGIMN